MNATTRRVSLCKHSFPCQPPLGTITRPGPCVHCGATWNEVQADLRAQEKALILGSSRDGNCPDCGQHHRLFRFQPQDKPWTDVDYVEPVSFLCMGRWNAAAKADRDGFQALLDAV